MATKELMVVRKDGSRIATSYDGDEFIIEAARGLPPPLVERITEYLGAAGWGVITHPTDVMIAIVWWMALQGEFDTWGKGAKVHAEKIDRILGVAWNGQTLEQIRIEMQLYLLWQQTELRGKFLLGFAGRLYGGAKISAPAYTLGGKIVSMLGGGYKGAAIPAVTIFLLAQVGSAIRVAHSVLQHEQHDNQIVSYIHAFVTGSAETITMNKELGAEQVAELRNILRENPDAIRFADPELQFLNWLVKGLAGNFHAEVMRLIASLGQNEAEFDSSWKLPSLNDIIPNELSVPTFWPTEIPSVSPGLPNWNIPWGVPQ